MYQCCYCNELHDENTRAVEHIIPEILLNDSLILPDTCKRWNNIFACAFESIVVHTEYVDDLRCAFDRTRRNANERYLGEVTTARGTVEHRWLKDGREYLGHDPNGKTVTNIVPVVIRDPSGQELRASVSLPFEVPTLASGPPDLLEKVRTRAEKKWEDAERYISDLLKKQGLPAGSDVVVARAVSITPAGPAKVVNDVLPKHYPIDVELWRKFYLKIAWCFAALKLGGTTLRNIGGERALGFLKHGLVDAPVVNAAAGASPDDARLLFRNANVEGEDVWFWRADIDAASKIVDNIADPAVRKTLSNSLSQRIEVANELADWVHLRQRMLEIPEQVIDDPGKRCHKISMEVAKSNGRCALGCTVELFGGATGAWVQVTPAVPDEGLPSQLATSCAETVVF